MTERLRTLALISRIEFVSHLRIKEAFFFGFIFPIFLYILFSLIWGVHPGYEKSLLAGIIAMNVASEAMLGIGPIIKIYRRNNILKFLRNLPMNVIYYFLGFFLSRIFTLMLSSTVLCFCAILIFNESVSAVDLAVYFSGIVLGTIMFSFMSLAISFFSSAEAAGRGLLSFLFYVMLFLSGALFPLFLLPPWLRHVANVLPMTHFMRFLSGEMIFLWVMLGWTVLFGGVFYLLFRYSSMKR